MHELETMLQARAWTCRKAVCAVPAATDRHCLVAGHIPVGAVDPAGSATPPRSSWGLVYVTAGRRTSTTGADRRLRRADRRTRR